MQAYIIRRVVLNIVVLWMVVTLVFFALRVLPGNYAVQQFASLNIGSVTPEAIELAEANLGLDRPFLDQYGSYLGNLLQGDLGESFRTKRSVWTELGKALPYSLELGLGIVAVGFLVALPVGIISAARQDRWPDYVLRGFAILALSAPVFWTASIATILVLRFDLFIIDVAGKPLLWENPRLNIQWMLIPMIAGGLFSTAAVMRLLRSQMLEVLREDYVRTARAKGLTERTIIVRHAMRNAMLPVVTVMGLTIATAIGGQVILENMFSVPGVGREFFLALRLRDYPLAQGLVIALASLVVFMNLIVDVAYGYLDPRVRLA